MNASLQVRPGSVNALGSSNMLALGGSKLATPVVDLAVLQPRVLLLDQSRVRMRPVTAHSGTGGHKLQNLQSFQLRVTAEVS